MTQETRLACATLLVVVAASGTHGESGGRFVDAYDDGALTRVVRPFLSIEQPFRLCGEERLFTWNMSFVHRAIVDEIRAHAIADRTTPLEVLSTLYEGALTGTALERCRWNKTRFLIQVAYFALYEDVLAPGEIVDDDAIGRVLAVRNALFDRWWEASAREDIVRAPSDFYEWEGEDLRGLSLDAYLAKESRILPWMSALGRRFVTPPAYGRDDDDDEAESAVHHLLRMRSPLSSLAPALAMRESARPPVQRAMACLANGVRAPVCDVNLWNVASTCAEDAGLHAHGDVLLLLGLFSSQEAFHLRDLRAYVDANLEPDDARARTRVFVDGARVYYRSQALAHACGVDAVLPSFDGLGARRRRSAKAYHAYSMAFSAYRLRSLGFDDETARSVPPAIGRSYKEKAVILGFVYDVVTGIPLERGATEDFAPVVDTQARGARLGSALFDADARAGRREKARVIMVHEVELGFAPRVMGYRWDERSEGLIVVVESGVFRGEREIRVPLDASAREAMVEVGHGFPRIRVMEKGLSVEG